MLGLIGHAAHVDWRRAHLQHEDGVDEVTDIVEIERNLRSIDLEDA